MTFNADCCIMLKVTLFFFRQEFVTSLYRKFFEFLMGDNTMKKPYKLFALVLSLIMLLCSALSCANNSEATQETTVADGPSGAVTDAGVGDGSVSAEEQTTALPEAYYLDELTDARFEGTTFTMIAEDTDQRPNFDCNEVNGDTVNDAIHERRLALEDRYGITVETVSCTSRGNCSKEVKTKVLADDDAYDLVFNAVTASGMKSLASAGCLTELSSLEYLDLSQPHWSQNFVNNMSVDGKMFFVAGGASPSYYLSAVAMVFNTQKAADYQFPDLYELVDEGKWTVDTVGELLKQSTHDLDGNNIYEPTRDFIGMAQTIEAGNSYFIAAGGNMIAKKANGSYSLDLGTAENVELMDKLRKVFGDPETTISIDAEDVSGLGNTKETKIGLFVEGNAMFATTAMMFAVQELRGIDSYGILPLPKLDEAQESYITPCNPYAPCGVGIPRSASDPELSALIMEAMAFLGEEMVRPAICDITLQGKLAQDEQSAKVLELIYSDIYFDFNHCFDFGQSTQLLRSYIVGNDGHKLINNRGFMSSYTIIERIAGIEMNELFEALAKLS